MTTGPIAVIGASGQVAHALQDVAQRFGFNLVARGRPGVDLASTDSLIGLLQDLRPQVVVNAAAYTAVDKAESEPEAAFRANAEGPARLATLCHAVGVPLIHISTDYVFGGQGEQPWRADDPVSPISVYGASKAAGEDAVRGIAARHVILRTSWVYGEHGGNFVKTMLRLGQERPEVRVVADQHGSPTYAPDLAVAILAIAARLASRPAEDGVWGTYHAAGSGETTWHGLAAETFRLAAARGVAVPRLVAIPTSDYPTPARRPANSRLDCHKLERVFGLRLPDWRTSLAICLDNLLAPVQGGRSS